MIMPVGGGPEDLWLVERILDFYERIIWHTSIMQSTQSARLTLFGYFYQIMRLGENTLVGIVIILGLPKDLS
jgi:hypothetical protein